MSDDNLTEFQRKRLQNIKRNNDLLKKLSLSGVANKIKVESGVTTDSFPKSKPKKKVSNAQVKKKKSVSPVPSLPTRRSRRLQGQEAVKLELGEDGISTNVEVEALKKEDLQRIKDLPIVGDIKLSDLVSGGDDDNMNEKFKYFANNNFSSGDFFEELKNATSKDVSKDLVEQREQFDLNLYPYFKPNDIKIAYHRITSLFFHPSIDKKLIVSGDTNGNVGFWNVMDEYSNDEEEVEPDISMVKLFTSNVARIDCYPTDSSRLLVASYDSYLRSIDLKSMKSFEILSLKDSFDTSLGISDFHFNHDNPNVLYMSTLSGEFLQLDLRMKSENLFKDFKRISDKKIGSFAINPKNSNEITTGSLDRTLRIWDLRKTVNNPDWSIYSDNDDYCSSFVIKSTYDSRLSVSAVSYSPTDNTLVCNGYDDTIRLFDISKKYEKKLNPTTTIKHNCQSGRWTSILKARFKPNENVFGIANMGKAIDIYNSTGQQLAHLTTTTVPATIAWHPMRNWIAGGNSSGKIFLFTDEKYDEVKEE